jgi:hypothetical protein
MSLTAFILHLRENESLTIHTESDFVRYELSVGIGTKNPRRIVGSIDIDQIKTTHHDVLAHELHMQLDAARVVQKAWKFKP